jgi:Bacterial membrane protein YfhO
MGRIVLIRDTAHWSLPLRRRLRERLLDGHLPTWDTTQAIGFPIVADPLIGTFYPPNFLYLLPNTGVIVSFDSLLHLVWGGLGMIFVLRRYSIHPVARLVGGVSWSLSGVAIGMWTAGVILQAMSWLPWAALAGISLAQLANGSRTRRESIRIVAFCSLPTAMGYLQGELFIATMGIGVAFWFGITTIRQEAGTKSAHSFPVKSVLRFIAHGAISLLGALLLASANWVVVAVSLSGTARKTKLLRETAESWSFHPLRFIEMVAPGSMGQPFGDQPGALYIGDNQNQFLAETVYLGISVVMLVLVGLGEQRYRRLVRSAMALGVGAMLIALGRHLPVHNAFRMLPPFGQMRYPEKYLVVVLIPVCVLAAMGAHRALIESKSIWKTLLIGPLATGALLLGNGLFPKPVQHYVFQGTVVSLVFSLFLLGVVFLGIKRKRITTVFLPTVVFLDLMLPTLSNMEYVPSELARRRPPLVDVIKHDGRDVTPSLTKRLFGDEAEVKRSFRPNRVSSYADAESIYFLTLTSHTGGPYGIADIIGNDAAIPRNWELISRTKSENFPLDLIRFASTDFIVSATNGWVSQAGYRPVGFDPVPGLRLFKVTDALPRSFIVTTTTPFKTKNPGEVYNRDVLAGKIAMTQPEDNDAVLRGNENDGGSCRIDDYRDDFLTATCDSKSSAMAVFVEQHAPGWEASVDGHPAKIFRVNRVMRGIRITQGQHKIVMRYHAPGLNAGLTLSLFGALLFGLTMVLTRQRPKVVAH